MVVSNGLGLLPMLYIGRPGFASRSGVPVSAKLAQQRRGGPAFAILLVPGLDLAVDLGDADAVGPIHQPAAVAREVEAAQPHHVDVAGAIDLALFEDLARLVDRGEEEPAEDLLVAEALLRDPSSAAFSLIMRASSGSGCGVRSPFS